MNKQTSTVGIGTSAAERIEKSLEQLQLNDAEITLILLKLELQLQYELGEELLNQLSEDKQELFNQMVQEGTPVSELVHFFDHTTKEQLNHKLENRLNNIADKFKLWLSKEEDNTHKQQVFRNLLNLPQH